MFEYFIPLIASFLGSGFFAEYLIPVFLLAVLASIPIIIREMVRIR